MGNARARKIPAQLVEDEDYQLRHERVAGIDIAKAKADVCTRLPPQREGGRRASRVEEVPAESKAILALAERLLADGVELVVMESTSDYWRIWLRREAPCCIPGLAGRNLEDIPGSNALLKIRKVKGTIAWCAARRFTVFPAQQGGTWWNVPGSDALPGAERLREQQHGSQPV